MSNITKNKNKDTIYSINKVDSLITFEGNNYNIDDHITAKNLIYMMIDKYDNNINLIEDYKHLLEVKEKNHNECRKTNVKLRDMNKRLEKEIKESDNLLSISIDEKKIIEKEKDKIKNSIEMFFRLNENIIKEF